MHASAPAAGEVPDPSSSNGSNGSSIGIQSPMVELFEDRGARLTTAAQMAWSQVGWGHHHVRH